uniref:Uncharacterized protein n=1 Tax=Nelumbo nucifera TaxID=4432 RepID=A0A822XJZ1_NELNU|nr:TPA_asm: hypothetical protein HUJ06_020914 [Nelumbo nucifera]
MAMELEDDVFFADLSQRIALLIMDDDEDPVARCPSVSPQFIESILSSTTAPTPEPFKSHVA